MPPTPEKEPTPTEGQLYKTWEVSAFNRETNEWETTLNHAYEHNTNEFEYQAEPARITPSRAKAPTREHKVYFAYGDAQIDYRNIDGELIPIHDERAINVALQLAKALRPELIVNLGDNVDLSNLSRFKKDSDHFFRTLAPSFQRAHDIYAQLRSDNPDAQIVEVSSNHEVRLRDTILQHIPNLYDVRRANEEKEKYPVMSYPYMANLERVGVDWIGGYGAAEFVINDDLAFRHGRETGNRTQSAASQIMRNHPETNNVHGHAHEMSTAYKTTRAGRLLASVAVGAVCRTDGVVPSYHNAVDDLNQPVKKQEQWQQGVLAIHDYGQGRYDFRHIPIVDGTAFYEGKEYKSE